jgi:hypothetical protein
LFLGSCSKIDRVELKQTTTMAAALRILGGAGIVAVSFFITLFLLDYYDDGGSNWQKRLLKGSPVVVNFNCGAQNVFDCEDSYIISYKGIGPGRCEHVLKNGEGPDLTGWCNARPEEYKFSIRGALFSFDQLGKVMIDGKVVGQLSKP